MHFLQQGCSKLSKQCHQQGPSVQVPKPMWGIGQPNHHMRTQQTQTIQIQIPILTLSHDLRQANVLVYVMFSIYKMESQYTALELNPMKTAAEGVLKAPSTNLSSQKKQRTKSLAGGPSHCFRKATTASL